MNKPVRRAVFAFTAVALVAGAGYHVATSGVRNIPYYDATAQQNLNPAQTAAVVFTGEDIRIRAALALYAQGHVDHVFISGYGGERKPWLVFAKYSDGKIPRRPASGITLERAAINTAENAQATASWLRGRKINNVILVTSDYHMPRSLMNLETEAGNKVALYQYPIKTHEPWLTRATEAVKSVMTYLGIKGAESQITGL